MQLFELQEVDEDSAELSISGGAASGLPSVQIIGGGSDDQGLSQQANQVVMSPKAWPFKEL